MAGDEPSSISTLAQVHNDTTNLLVPSWRWIDSAVATILQDYGSSCPRVLADFASSTRLGWICQEEVLRNEKGTRSSQSGS